QVYRNKGETWLYGDGGDDSFFIKATLGVTNLSSGKGKNKVGYNRNAPLHIDGGSGFDTIILEGTEIGDRIIIFVDDDGVQQIKGAGISLDTIKNIESIQINAIDGDDEIYVYGVNGETRLTINTGRGNDAIFMGGPAQTFDPINQSIDLDTTAAEAKVPIITYANVTDFVPGFTRVERTVMPDGTQEVRQVFVPGYEIVKRIATVTLHSVSSTTQKERTSLAIGAVKIGRTDDLSGFDNLVILDGTSGSDSVDFQLYGDQDGSLADGALSVTDDRDILIRALKAVYGQSYAPEESELIRVDSPDNQNYGWVTGFGSNRQGIVLDNIELLRMQFGAADNNITVEAVDRDILNAVISLGEGDDTINVGRMQELDDEPTLGDGKLIGLSVAGQNAAVRDWFTSKEGVLSAAGLTQLHLLATAVREGVQIAATALETWLATINLSTIDGTVIDDDWAEQNGPLYSLSVLSQSLEVRDWLAARKPALDLMGLSELNFLTAVVLEENANAASVETLNIYYNETGFLAGLNSNTLDAAWRLANPRMGGVIGSLEDILSRAVLIGGTGDDTVRIYDSARADALRVRVSATTLKPFQPDDPSVASPEEISKDPLQQRINFSQLDLAPRYGDEGPSGAIALNSFELNEVYLGAGNDRVDVTAAILPLFIYAGGGDDEFFVGSTPDNALNSNLDGIQNTTINLDGGTGSTQLVVSRGGDPTGTIELTDSAIVVRHFASDDLALAPIVSSVRYMADVTNARVLAGSYRGEIRAGFDR
ncbi:hypothetical protein N9L70_11420, partial [Rhodobacteraceae bacterium]|nr:hypothetical protein [Paracoccaceae bacterium]